MFGKFLLTTNTKSNIIRAHCHPMQGNADSGIREIFACGILNAALWSIGIWSPSSTDKEFGNQHLES